MPAWRLRDYHDEDLDQAIQVWDQSRGPGSAEPVFSVAEVMAAARAGQPAVVAEVGDEVVGMAVAQTQGERAWILLVALSSRWRHRGIGSALLTDLERRLRSQGVRRIYAVLTEGATGTVALENSGYARRDGLIYYEMLEHLGLDQANLLDELGGQILPPGLWGDMAGMETEKAIIERSSRLGWPFVELFPSRLAATGSGGLAASLREAFAELAELDELVLFIDEVEEIATARSGASTAELGVTNELLKLIPAFRQHDSRLLVCATNAVHSLDSAFLRPGRFDYVIPVGPPDQPARRAIWQRYLSAASVHANAHIDVDRLVTASELFTPADIEFAARKGAQAAFEREMLDARGQPAETGDYLRAINEIRPTLSAEMLAEFERGKEDFARL